MASDMKSGLGFLIPTAGVVGFFTSLFLGEFLISIIIAVLGILIWFLYMLVMESHIPEEMGNMIILFGVLLSVGIFFGFGIKENMWGGFELQSEGSIFSLVILFFAILTGLNFRNQQSSILAPSNNSNSGLTNEDRDLVMDAIKKTKEANLSSKNPDPKVIVVKQEVESSSNNKNHDEKNDVQTAKGPAVVDSYNMAQNPYFTYPPDYYYDEEDEDEDEYEDEDEWEYEDEWDDEED